MPLTVQPVVVNRRTGDQRERNLELGTSWFQNPDEWAAMPADDGPDDWQRIDVEVDQTPHATGKRHGQTEDARSTSSCRCEPIAAGRPLPDRSTVSNVQIDEQSLSFDVDQIGVPVLVKVSYFPNWEVSGAEGPYRVGTEHDGRRPDQQPRQHDVRALDARLRRLPCSRCSASGC